MKKIIVAMYDVKVGVYDRPMMFNTKSEAVRALQDIVGTPGNMISTHPEDFRMDVIGEFNIATGEIEQVNCPQLLAEASQCKKVE